MEILLKRNTSVGPSPKKFKIDMNIIIPLEEVKKKEEFDRVSVKVKVLKAKETTTVSTGKKSPGCVCWRRQHYDEMYIVGRGYGGVKRRMELLPEEKFCSRV